MHFLFPPTATKLPLSLPHFFFWHPSIHYRLDFACCQPLISPPWSSFSHCSFLCELCQDELSSFALTWKPAGSGGCHSSPKWTVARWKRHSSTRRGFMRKWKTLDSFFLLVERIIPKRWWVELEEILKYFYSQLQHFISKPQNYTSGQHFLILTEPRFLKTKKKKVIIFGPIKWYCIVLHGAYHNLSLKTVVGSVHVVHETDTSASTKHSQSNTHNFTKHASVCVTFQKSASLIPTVKQMLTLQLCLPLDCVAAWKWPLFAQPGSNVMGGEIQCGGGYSNKNSFEV